MKRSRPELILVPSLRDAWDDALVPWFKRVAPNAWANRLPSLVIVPTRGQANDLKGQLIARGQSYLGLQFATPATFRALLAREDAAPLAEPTHLRLLLAIAASEIETSSNEAEALAASAVARAPAPLLRALNRLATTGWKFEELGLQSFALVVQRFNALLRKCGFALPGETDRKRLRATKPGQKKFSQILVAGFDGTHWPDWFLLRVAVALSEHATVVFEEPTMGDVDLCWVGSWEEVCGEAQRATKSVHASADSFFSEAEMRGSSQPAKQFDFLVGSNVSEQAEAVAHQCIRYLAEKKCTRVGVIFAGPGALPRLVADALTRLNIPHNDGLAHKAPGIFDTAEWRAWLQLQRTPRLNSFLQFLSALPDSTILSADVSRSNFEKVLRDAYSEILLDDLDLLREFCAANPAEQHQAVGEALRSIPLLPQRACLTEFLKRTDDAFEYLGWKRRALEVANVTRAWPQLVESPFSRALFLRWLEETSTASSIARSTAGDHPYARVQLLTVPQAQNQQWSHLIFAGWNEGTWPPPAGAEFAREEEIRAFNRRVQQLNRRAAQQGSQGEGHISVHEDHSLYLGPNEQRAVARRQFDRLLESVSENVTFAASLVRDGEPERFWNPSELFTQIYLKATQRSLTQNAMRELQVRTRSWLEKSADLTTKKKATRKDVQQTRIAYDQRRDVTAQSGIYDFAFPSKPNRNAVFSVSEFDRFISAPALVWMKHYLGVKAIEDDAHIWAASSGRWIHDWLNQIAEATEKKFNGLPNANEIDRRVVAAAKAKRAKIEALCERASKSLPDWWRSGWENALFLARVLGERLNTASDWPWIATEWKIEDEVPAKIGDDATLTFRGRIDLILARGTVVPKSFVTDELWIIDYKTGAKKPLKPPIKKRLLDGTALQLSLYASALQARGTKRTLISILSPLVRPLEPQLENRDVEAEQEIFLELSRMQHSGVFGMHGALRGAFRLTDDYPLATLGIDQDTLEQRWENTHPALVRDDEEFFW